MRVSPLRYYIETDIGGIVHWWRRSSYGITAGWVTSLREASSYGQAGFAALALHQMRLHGKITVECVIRPYNTKSAVPIGLPETVNAYAHSHT